MAEMWINMGPQHPMTHGLWNLRIKVDGETIVDAEPEIGYLHRGYEKIMDVREFQKNVVLTALLWALRERELFLDLLQLITGARMNQNYPRIGGVRNDAPPDFEKYCAKVIAHFRNKLKEHEAVFEQSKLFQARTVGVGRLTRAQALDWGVTGPNLRACGASIDLRKLDPYDAYPALSFAPAVEKEGDSS